MKKIFLSVLPLLMLLGCDTNGNGDGLTCPAYFSIWEATDLSDLYIIASFTDQEDTQAIEGHKTSGYESNFMAQVLSGNYIIGGGAKYNHLLDIHTTVGCMPSPIHKATYNNLFLIFETSFVRDAITVCPYYGTETHDRIEGHPHLSIEKVHSIYNHIVVSHPENPKRTDYVYTFLDAGFNQIRIKADKDLWGIKAGEDVSDKFRILAMQDLMLSYPDFEIAKQCGEMPAEKLSELKGLMMKQCPICIKMADVPSEIYDKVEFTIEVDVMLPDDKVQTISNKVTVEFEN